MTFEPVCLPNKPMVPTAHNGPHGNSLDPLRRHIGQSLDSFDRRREVEPGRARPGPESIW